MVFKVPENSLYQSIASAPPSDGDELKYWVSSEPKTTTVATTYWSVLNDIREIQKDINDERERRAAMAEKYPRAPT